VSSTVGHSSPPSVSHPVLPSTVRHSVQPSVGHPVQSTFTVPIVSKVGGGLVALPMIYIFNAYYKNITPFGFTGGKVITLLLSGLLKMLTITSLLSSSILRDGLRKFRHKDVEFSKINYKLRLPGVEIKPGRKRPNYSHKFKKLGHWLHSDSLQMA
jgi:hypothetical protein